MKRDFAFFFFFFFFFVVVVFVFLCWTERVITRSDKNDADDDDVDWIRMFKQFLSLTITEAKAATAREWREEKSFFSSFPFVDYYSYSSSACRVELDESLIHEHTRTRYFFFVFFLGKNGKLIQHFSPIENFAPSNDNDDDVTSRTSESRYINCAKQINWCSSYHCKIMCRFSLHTGRLLSKCLSLVEICCSFAL